MKPLRILCYHIIDEYNNTSMDYLRIPFDLFREQINWLIDNGWTGITVDKYNELSESDTGKYFQITFDDAYKNEDSVRAYEYLNSLKIPFTIFATESPFNSWDKDKWIDDAGFIENHYPLFTYSELVPKKSQWKYLHLGYHTDSHKNLLELGPFKVHLDVRYSDIVGTDHLCIPYGAYNEFTISKLQELGYKYIYTLKDGSYLHNGRVSELNRLFISGGRSIMDFKLKMIFGMNIRYQLKKFFKMKNLYKKV